MKSNEIEKFRSKQVGCKKRLDYKRSDYFTGKNYFTEKKGIVPCSSVYTICGIYGLGLS